MHPAETAQDNREKRGQFASLSHAIQHLHAAIVELPDAASVSKATAALNTLTSIQEQQHKPYIGPEKRT